MYIKKIKINNLGPIEDLNIVCPFTEDQHPLPLLLIGANGSGKTSIIANILDTAIEFKRQRYRKIEEVEGDNYLKVGKKTYITTGKEFSYVNITCEYSGFTAAYVDFARLISQEAFDQKFSRDDFEYINWNDQKLSDFGYFKYVNTTKEFLKSFEDEVILYFPFSRYEIPAWWNPTQQLNFKMQEKYIDVSDRNLIKSNVVKEVEEWLLNVFLDCELYEKQLLNLGSILPAVPNTSIPAGINNLNVLTGYVGKNTSIKNNVNEILTALYKAKNSNIEYVRLGISEKTYRRIAVISKIVGEDEIEVAPTISHLSSGELMVFALFCSIVKEYDLLNKGNNIDLKQISGTVIVDEIDLHLHIDLQKNLLPKLLKMFPKIQFIITTHSPLFLLGVEEVYQDIKAINLPQGNLIPLSEFSEVEQAFDIFVSKFTKYKETYEAANKAIQQLRKPLVITEGKTDWKHMKKSLDRFKASGDFLTLDFDFLEYEDDINMGDSELMSLSEQFCKTPQTRKIICIFDRDNPKIVTKLTERYVHFGNDVFAFCIPKPRHRENYKNISIEFYYEDQELQTIDESGKCLLFSNEVEKRITQPMSKKASEINYIKLDVPLAEDELEKKIYDQDVDQVVNNAGTSVGLSKSVFAQYVLEDKDGYQNFGIEPFREIFNIIAEILA